MLTASDIDVYIEGNPIIRKASFDIFSGAVTGLLGRNGAGKTTLLRSLMGLNKIASGLLTLEGPIDLRASSPSDRARLGIGYLPEDRRLISSITAEENILLPHWAMKIERVNERIEWVYSIIPECRPLANRRASLLSGGQQKLVALARALLVGHRLLLLDEPTEGVAPALAFRILEILQVLAKEKHTIMIAESDAQKLRLFSDHIYCIDRGRIEVAG